MTVKDLLRRFLWWGVLVAFVLTGTMVVIFGPILGFIAAILLLIAAVAWGSAYCCSTFCARRSARRA